MGGIINDPDILLTAFLLGLLGSGHCLGMCGGLASGLGLNTPQLSSKSSLTSHLKPFFLYNLGRVTSYIIAGVIVGSLGFWLSKNLASALFLRYLAAIMLILMGLYIGKWFNGILFAEKLGAKIWPLLRPLATRYIPIKKTGDAYIVGLIWGWLPCGLVYSALIWASMQGNILGAALIMFLFGLGTLPAMLATGIFAQRLNHFVKHSWFRRSSALLMIFFGIWTLPILQSLIHQSMMN